jgi:hypothetical protein
MTIKVSLTVAEIETLRSVLISAANTATATLHPAEQRADYLMSIRSKLTAALKQQND